MSRRPGRTPPSADVVIAEAAARLRAALVALDVGFTEQPGMTDAARVPIYAGTLAAVTDTVIAGLGEEGQALAEEARTIAGGRLQGGW